MIGAINEVDKEATRAKDTFPFEQNTPNHGCGDMFEDGVRNMKIDTRIRYVNAGGVAWCCIAQIEQS